LSLFESQRHLTLFQRRIFWPEGNDDTLGFVALGFGIGVQVTRAPAVVPIW
jgi:hypothetical protein